MRTLWPRSFKRISSLSSSTSFPLLRTSCCWEKRKRRLLLRRRHKSELATHSGFPLQQQHLEGFRFAQVVLWGPDQVAVVAALLQLHHDVEEARRAAFDAFTQSFVVPGQDPSEGGQSRLRGEEFAAWTGPNGALTCNTASGWRSSPRAESAPLWQEATSPRPS